MKRVLGSQVHVHNAMTKEDLLKHVRAVKSKHECLNPDKEVSVTITPDPNEVVFDGYKAFDFTICTSLLVEYETH